MKKHLIVLLLFCFIVFVNSAYAGYTNITTETFGTTMEVTEGGDITNEIIFSCYEWMSISGASASGSKPADIKLNDNGFIVAEFTDNKEEFIQANVKIPSDMDFTKNCSLCIGWSSPSTDKVCKWSLTYLVTKLNEDTEVAGTLNETWVNSSQTADGLVIHNLVIFEVGDITSNDLCLHIQIMRDGDDATDTINDIVEVHGIAFGYTCTNTSTTTTTTSSNDTFIVHYQPSSNIMGVVGLMGLISIPFIAYIWNKKKDEY